MSEWSDALVDHLDGIEAGLASTFGLAKGLRGDLFEECLGSFLAWTRSFDATDRFKQVGRLGPAGIGSGVGEWLAAARNRTTKIMEGVTESMWKEFGADRIDLEAASAAYRGLIGALGAGGEAETRFAFATTNYDRSGEMSLSALGYQVDTGARGEVWQTRRINPDAIQAWADPGNVPHLHLHGAVGWYREHGSGIRVLPADQDYDSRQAPAVLYPDPAKDPEGELEMGVGLIWRKFRELASTASHVLVVGHSLHDRPLVAVLADAADGGARIAVSYLEDPAPILAQLRDHERLRSGAVDLSLVDVRVESSGSFDEVARWMTGQIIAPAV
jgi:hypothetical protein